jgi:hypothetical protein
MGARTIWLRSVAANLPLLHPRAGWGVALLLLVEFAAHGCKAPREPHKPPENDVSGTWTAEAEQARVPMSWEMRLEQQDAGKLEGEGRVTRGGSSSRYSVSGVRATHEIRMDFHLDRTRARFSGSVLDPVTIVGRVYLETDTVPLTFRRE